MSDSKVGIIVLNWNGLSDTRDCLQSLFRMETSGTVVYVVDNASSDGSVEALLREFGDRIQLIVNERNLLYAGGNNVGIRQALSDGCTHLLLLNNDTVVDSQLLDELLRVSDTNRDTVLCPKIYYAQDANRLWYAGGLINLRRARTAHRGIREVDRGQYNRLEETGWATGCALFASREVFERVGLLDESLVLYNEDVDFCLRARAAGFRIFYVPKAMLWHKVSASIGGNLSRRKLRMKWCSLRRLLSKHLPNPIERNLALMDFVVTETLRVAVATLKGDLK